MSAAPIVSLEDVFCVHRTSEGDVAALQGAQLDLADEELLCVLGPSGAGKTTLLRVIAGLQIPAAGVVKVSGLDMGRLPARRRAELRHRLIGFLPQRAGALLAPDLRVAEAVGLPQALRGTGRTERRKRTGELLEAAGLAGIERARGHELSGGERQRVALCAALAHRPRLLLADEPTAELDAGTAGTVRRAIAELAGSQSLSAIVVSHDQATEEIAQRTVRIRDGRIAQEGSGADGALVVDRGGWVRLPEELLGRAGIDGRVQASAEPGRLVLQPAGAASGARAPQATPPGHQASVAPQPCGTAAPERLPAARVSVRALSRTLGRGSDRRTVLSDLTLAFAPARLHVLTGPSGSGKTTLLRLLAGLDHAQDGTVELDGEPLARLDPEGLAALRRMRVGYLAQDPVPIGFLSAIENVALGLRLRGWGSDAASARALAVLREVGLAERARQRVARLSAGEAQRVALARALAAANGLLLTDEPTSRLDRAAATAVAELLVTAAAGGQTVVCASHDPEIVARADAVIELAGEHLRAAPSRQSRERNPAVRAPGQ